MAYKVNSNANLQSWLFLISEISEINKIKIEDNKKIEKIIIKEKAEIFNAYFFFKS